MIIPRIAEDNRQNESYLIDFPSIIRGRREFNLIYTEYRSKGDDYPRSRYMNRENRPSVETEIPEIHATRDLMKVCGEDALSRTRGGLHLAAVIMHAHAACRYFNRNEVACNFELRRSMYVGCTAKIADKRAPKKKWPVCKRCTCATNIRNVRKREIIALLPRRAKASCIIYTTLRRYL